MLKPTASYKMSKATKTSLALGRFKSKEQRSDWKRSMIQAELASKLIVKPPKKDKNFTGQSASE